MQAEDAGSYAGEYLANAAGTYALTASVNGVPLSTVYTVTIAAGQIRVENSESTLTGWSDGEDVTAGTTLAFDIVARDKGARLCLLHHARV